MELKAKDKHGNVVPYHPHGKHWVDGTIAFDLPMQRLSELFNINQVCVYVCVAHPVSSPVSSMCVYVYVARPVSSPVSSMCVWHSLW